MANPKEGTRADRKKGRAALEKVAKNEENKNKEESNKMMQETANVVTTETPVVTETKVEEPTGVSIIDQKTQEIMAEIDKNVNKANAEPELTGADIIEAKSKEIAETVTKVAVPKVRAVKNDILNFKVGEKDSSGDELLAVKGALQLWKKAKSGSCSITRAVGNKWVSVAARMTVDDAQKRFGSMS